VKPTLPTFSLDGHVGIVTGGARGLGLVMGQGMVFSGSHLALVDMNSKCISYDQRTKKSY
jgi:NAD(P)-dependent dehydrogenase (short-subunit alcohol dehydrogenase family)